MKSSKLNVADRTSLAPPLAPIVRQAMMHEQVYLQIRESLSDGRFRPGEILTIRNLARQLGTSVMPVRQALHKLTAEQVLHVNEARTVKVAELGVAEFQEICEARMLLEGELAALAARRANADDIARIERANDDLNSPRTSRDPTLSLKRNREFHFAVYAAAHHSIMFELVEPLWVRCGPSMLGLYEDLSSEQLKKAALRTHQTTLDGILARKPSEAQRGIVEDITATIGRYREHLKKLGTRSKRSTATV